MPIYAYRCSTCGHAKDVLQKMSDPLLSVCPACGEATFVKQVTAAGFQLKGSGWYVTDFRGGNNAKPKADGDDKKAEGGDKKAEAGDGKGAGGKGAGGEGAGKGDTAQPASVDAAKSAKAGGASSGGDKPPTSTESKPAVTPKAGAAATKPAASGGGTS